MAELICLGCGRTYNAWSISFKGSPPATHGRCQRCRATATRGEKRPAHKLTEYDVVQIRRRLATGEHPKAIAPDFHITDKVIYEIRARRAWKHVA